MEATKSAVHVVGAGSGMVVAQMPFTKELFGRTREAKIINLFVTSTLSFFALTIAELVEIKIALYIELMIAAYYVYACMRVFLSAFAGKRLSDIENIVGAERLVLLQRLDTIANETLDSAISKVFAKAQQRSSVSAMQNDQSKTEK